MIDKLIFYNHYGNGDVHYSRDFVKDIMKKIPAKSYEYYHRHNIGLLKDIPNLHSYNNVNTIKQERQEQIYLGDEIFINTWVGQKGASYLKYNCSMYSNYNMFKDIYKQLNIKIEDIDYYLPSINFEYTNNIGVDNFIEKYNNIKVFISNGDVFSGQATNFSFNTIIYELSKQFKDVFFILSHNSNTKGDNIFQANDIIKDDSNLNELSYLSTYCDIVVGRASGPYCFTQIKDNFFDEHMTFISFSNDRREGLYYGFMDDLDTKKVSCKQLHSSVYDKSMIDIIKKEIECII